MRVAASRIQTLAEYQQWRPGAPHGETAGIVQGDGWTENDSDGGVFDKCPKSRLVEGTFEGRPVLHRDQG